MFTITSGLLALLVTAVAYSTVFIVLQFNQIHLSSVYAGKYFGVFITMIVSVIVFLISFFLCKSNLVLAIRIVSGPKCLYHILPSC